MILIGLGIMVRMRLLTLVVGGCLGGLSMFDVIILGFVRVGASSVCIGFSLPLPGRLSIMMKGLVLLWILRFGLLGVLLKGVGLCMRFGIEPFYLVQLVSGTEESLLLRLLLPDMTLSFGHILLACL